MVKTNKKNLLFSYKLNQLEQPKPNRNKSKNTKKKQIVKTQTKSIQVKINKNQPNQIETSQTILKETEPN